MLVTSALASVSRLPNDLAYRLLGQHEASRLIGNAVPHDLQRHLRHVCIALPLPGWCAE